MRYLVFIGIVLTLCSSSCQRETCAAYGGVDGDRKKASESKPAYNAKSKKTQTGLFGGKDQPR